MVSLYLRGDSLIHRTPAWLKLALLCVCGTSVMLVNSPFILGVALGVVIISLAVARIRLAVVWRISRTILLFVLVIAACQWFFASLIVAVMISLRILFLVAAANLLTLTTEMSDLITTVDTLLSPLRRWGLYPDKVGIAIALTLRFIPVLVEQGAMIREAQSARGVKARFTYLVPLIIRTLRMAEGVGEALEVRGTAGAQSWRDQGPRLGDLTCPTGLANAKSDENQSEQDKPDSHPWHGGKDNSS
ncbi:MAG: energy-coupling factor transporter transmembrane protein EcfT [Propionibacteriaceae bacterium]|nr:energy-coupling factor transporter transmembrane protein EcfT [Propionibacteriaceae bacterium]